MNNSRIHETTFPGQPGSSNRNRPNLTLPVVNRQAPARPAVLPQIGCNTAQVQVHAGHSSTNTLHSDGTQSE